ncbi:hypothetical protein [Macrococcus bovicus]|uniref:Uncharacterized protein n=1 Tax=Macrococcus bovicus TaxID=69968 RepID=A0A4R6C2X1_9STAP|nr:hypothetical protein [Macrococcus bovicus]TDM15720.1 hypothetical protein ERX55_02095 [Macrococcus bovicus]
MRLPFLQKRPKQVAKFKFHEKGIYNAALIKYRNNPRYRVVEEDTYFLDDKGGRITFYCK